MVKNYFLIFYLLPFISCFFGEIKDAVELTNYAIDQTTKKSDKASNDINEIIIINNTSDVLYLFYYPQIVYYASPVIGAYGTGEVQLEVKGNSLSFIGEFVEISYSSRNIGRLYFRYKSNSQCQTIWGQTQICNHNLLSWDIQHEYQFPNGTWSERNFITKEQAIFKNYDEGLFYTHAWTHSDNDIIFTN